MRTGSPLRFLSFLAFTAVMLGLGGRLAAQSITLSVLGEYKTGVFDASSAEIVAHDPATQRLFIVRGDAPVMDIISIANPAAPAFAGNINLAALWNDFGGANSVAVYNGIVAVAVQADPKTDPGRVYFFDASGNYLNHVTVGNLPDMLTFTADGSYVLTANEGEPNDDYTVDPEGSVSVIDLSSGVAAATVATATFASFNASKAALQAAGVRIYGPGATVAQDLEPEYITTQGDMAWVSLQENNALAIVQISTATVQSVVPLGFKDHSLAANAFDPSDRDGGINIGTWPVYGMYQPDAIASTVIDGVTYIVSANEGDSRDYDGYSEEEDVEDITLDATAFPNAAFLQQRANLGRLGITSANGDTDNDGDFDVLYANGARSFSIWDASGNLVWDSGDQFERKIAELLPTEFNTDNDENDFDGRSDAKGPEPEAIAISTICGRTYAFIGLERIGGIMVYDISNPAAPVFQQYINNRDFTQEPGPATVNTIGDLGPEGLIFIDAADSPNNHNLLVCASEVSGTVTLFSVTDAEAPVITAALPLVDQVNGSKGDFEAQFSAADNCDTAPMLHAIMDIPAVDNNTMVSYSYAQRPRLKFDPVMNSVEVEAPNPQQFWADILAAGGVPVSDGQEFEFDLLPNYSKFDYEFTLAGALRKIKAASASMTVTASDAANNVSSVTIPALFPAPKNSADSRPETVLLAQNYPNPFNPSTTIAFTLPESGAVTLTVHDMLGRRIATLASGVMDRGTHRVAWDGRNAAGQAVPSGMYIYTLQSGAHMQSRSMLLAK